MFYFSHRSCSTVLNNITIHGEKSKYTEISMRGFCMSDGFEHWNEENIEWKKCFTSNIKF